MRRRQFIGGLAAILPPLSRGARAQVPAKPALIAILSTGSEADVRWEGLRRSLRLGLQELGYTEGRHYVLEERFAAGVHSRLPMLSGELVRRKPDIIVSSSGPAALAAQNITSHIPIISPALARPWGLRAKPGQAEM
jgi:putative tryptophan/tyrosine transport system substrate-binding protein